MEGNVIREHGVGTVGVLSWVRLLALHSSNLRMESLFYCLTSPQLGTSGLLQHLNTHLEGLTRRYSFVAHIWFVPHQLAIKFSQLSGDNNGTTTLEVFVGDVPIRTIEWNGQRLAATKTLYGSHCLNPGHRAQSTDRSHFHP